jgi:quinol monooxygenase YgiN
MVFPESDDVHALRADDQMRARGPYAASPVVTACCTSRGVLRPLIREAHLSEEHETQTEMYFFARFHARPGNERAVAGALLDVLAPSREEPGCVSIQAYRSIRDPRLFYIHSRWKRDAAFEGHTGLSQTVRFIERVEPLIDHSLDTTRAEKIG